MTSSISPNPDLSLEYVIVSMVDPIMLISNAQHMANHVNYVVKRTILPKSVILQKTGSKQHKSFKYQEVNVAHESSDHNGQIDEISSKVKSLYYHYVHFYSMNTRVQINLSTKSCDGSSLKNSF